MATAQTRFAINGAHGRMGQAVARVLDEARLPISARFDKDQAQDLTQSDVVIDFSTPEASLNLLDACAAEGLSRPRPLVHIIGSTGFNDYQETLVAAHADQVVIIKSGNFSLGVNLLAGLVKQASARLSALDWDIEVTEAHHKRKVDAPSGTALMLGEAAAFGRNTRLPDVKVTARDGITGPRGLGDIGFSVVRARRHRRRTQRHLCLRRRNPDPVAFGARPHPVRARRHPGCPMGPQANRRPLRHARRIGDVIPNTSFLPNLIGEPGSRCRGPRPQGVVEGFLA